MKRTSSSKVRGLALALWLAQLVGCGSGVDAGEQCTVETAPDGGTPVAADFACVPPVAGDPPRLCGSRSATNLRVAIFPVLFSDQDEVEMPTRQEIADKFGGCDMQRLFYDNSSGEAAFEVEVAPWLKATISQADMGDDNVISKDEIAPIALTHPSISGDTHFIVLLMLGDPGRSLGGSWTSFDYDGITDPRPTLNGELVPHMMLLTDERPGFDRSREYGVALFDPRVGAHDSREGVVEPEGRPIGLMAQTFGHEMVHYLGHGPHANSWDRGERFFFEPSDVDDELRENYGNHFALLGTSSGLSPVIHGAHRRSIGWGRDLTTQLAVDEDRRVTLAPLNRRAGTTMVYFESRSAERQRIHLELREDDGWHDFIANTPFLAGNLDGIMVLVENQEGTERVSYLVDASPMPRATNLFPDQDLKTFDDVVLKPGMEFHMPEMSLSDVRPETDGHMSVRVQTFSTSRQILHRPVRPTLALAGNTATVTWEGSTHPDTTGFEVEVVAADGSSVSTTADGASATSASLDASSLLAGGELHARVRAVGGGLAANWSRLAYIIM